MREAHGLADMFERGLGARAARACAAGACLALAGGCALSPVRPSDRFGPAAATTVGGGPEAVQPVYRLGVDGLVPQGAEEESPDAALIAQARGHIARGNPNLALEALNPWLRANERSGSPLVPTALLARGDARSAGGNEFTALYDYEDIIAGFPSSPEYVFAIERELEIALAYLGGLRRKFVGVRVFPATAEAEELLIRVHERLPGSRLAERAIVALGDHYYRRRELGLAADVYQRFLENFPGSVYRARAQQRRIYATLGRFRGPEYDTSVLVGASVLIKQYMASFPAEAERSQIDEPLLTFVDDSTADQFMVIGLWYLRRGDPVAARYTLGRLITQHPRSAAAQEARALFAEYRWDDPASAPASPGPARGDAPPAQAQGGAS
ncbi:MAG: hypothetical protein C0475_01430 [Planctomyces sp.]|nr:hypothetical protein [Planctomyces sp.]MBA4039018.1 hypothetical protein [Planctomyces sp.]MBA4119245.1 hypothetical protein [Isosphaera sp.]